MYLGETYENFLLQSGQNFYGETPVTLPKPELYVVYTGDKEHTEKEISIAETHWNGDNSVLDVKVKVFYGDNTDKILSQYIAFTKVFKEKRKAFGATEEAVQRTIDECINRNILKDYFESKRTEVINIMMALYNKELIQTMYGNSKKAEGELLQKEKTAILMIENNYPIEEISKISDLPISRVKELIEKRKNFQPAE